MLDAWYQDYGFIGAMILSFVLVLTFFTWMAAISGVFALERYPRFARFIWSVLLIVFPPSSIVFLSYQVAVAYAQNKRARRQFRPAREMICPSGQSF